MRVGSSVRSSSSRISEDLEMEENKLASLAESNPDYPDSDINASSCTLTKTLLKERFKREHSNNKILN